MTQRIIPLFLALLTFVGGLTLGLVVLNLILYLNTGLLLRGMSAPAPVDPALIDKRYDVYQSDGDLFYWQSDQIRPLPPDNDRLVAQVHYYTDEFGFPNQAPLPAQVDMIVIGRSYSMGAQSGYPWVRQLEALTGLKVLNLSQTGSGIQVKKQHLERFGLSRHPRWVILEVLPSMDIIGYSPDNLPLLAASVFPVVQTFVRHYAQRPQGSHPMEPIYPIALDLRGETIAFSEYNPYLAALSVDPTLLQDSQNWALFRQDMQETIEAARKQGACAAILYAPTKSEVYIPLLQSPDQLESILNIMSTWELDNQTWLVQDHSRSPRITDFTRNAGSARLLVKRFAQETGILLIDPTEQMAQAMLQGDPPFLEYDTHWSLTGHRIVASVVAEALRTYTCP